MIFKEPADSPGKHWAEKEQVFLSLDLTWAFLRPLLTENAWGDPGLNWFGQHPPPLPLLLHSTYCCSPKMLMHRAVWICMGWAMTLMSSVWQHSRPPSQVSSKIPEVWGPFLGSKKVISGLLEATNKWIKAHLWFWLWSWAIFGPVFQSQSQYYTDFITSMKFQCFNLTLIRYWESLEEVGHSRWNIYVPACVGLFWGLASLRACGGNARFVSVLSDSVPGFLLLQHLALAPGLRCHCKKGEDAEHSRGRVGEKQVRPQDSRPPGVRPHHHNITTERRHHRKKGEDTERKLGKNLPGHEARFQAPSTLDLNGFHL